MSGEPAPGLQFRLGERDREDFSWPRGVLVSGELPREVAERPWPKVICVGDVVTDYCLRAGRLPDVAVLDGRTRRQDLGDHVLPQLAGGRSYAVLRVPNPPGGLTPDAVEAVCSAVRFPRPTLVVVSGEEDMLTLAALMCAPPGSLVVYGIPGRGASLVVVDELISREAQTRLLRLVPEPMRA